MIIQFHEDKDNDKHIGKARSILIYGTLEALKQKCREYYLGPVRELGRKYSFQDVVSRVPEAPK